MGNLVSLELHIVLCWNSIYLQTLEKLVIFSNQLFDHHPNESSSWHMMINLLLIMMIIILKLTLVLTLILGAASLASRMN